MAREMRDRGRDRGEEEEAPAPQGQGFLGWGANKAMSGSLAAAGWAADGLASAAQEARQKYLESSAYQQLLKHPLLVDQEPQKIKAYYKTFLKLYPEVVQLPVDIQAGLVQRQASLGGPGEFPVDIATLDEVAKLRRTRHVFRGDEAAPKKDLLTVLRDKLIGGVMGAP